MSQVQQNLHQTLVSTNEEEEEEEALSISDLPSKPSSPPSSKLNLAIPNPTDDFEFRVSFSANESDVRAEMCVADDVFYNGTILPLRPSVSSRTDSTDLSVLSTSRSGSSSSSSGSSSYCVSRSHSTKSASGAVLLPVPDPPRRSVSNNFFYAFPSPSPQLRSTGARKSNAMSSGRKSTSSVPGNILRLGVLPAPEIDIRSRRTTEKRSNIIVEKKQQLGFGSYGAFGCKCVPDEVIEPTGTLTSQSKLEASRKGRNGEDKGGRKVEKKSSPLKFNLRMVEKSMCRTRILHWIEELSIGKTS